LRRKLGVNVEGNDEKKEEKNMICGEYNI